MYFNECSNHSLFEPKPVPLQTGGIIWCCDWKHHKKCLEDSKKTDKYKIGTDILYLDGSENIPAKIVKCENKGFFRIKLENPEKKHNSTIIEARKTFSPYDLTAL